MPSGRSAASSRGSTSKPPRRAIVTHVGEPLGLDATAAADGDRARRQRAHGRRASDSSRSSAATIRSDFALMPFGGGGALHAGALIREVGLKAAIVPRFPGLTSALGCVIADLRHDRVQTLNLMLDGLDAAALDRRSSRRARAVKAMVESARVFRSSASTSLFELDMHYVGQTHAIAAPLPVAFDRRRIRRDGGERARGVRERATRRASAASSSGAPDQDRFAARDGDRPPPAFRSFDACAGAGSVAGELRGAACARSGSTGRAAKQRSGRGSICRSARIVAGPAILEQPDATIVVEPGQSARVDRARQRRDRSEREMNAAQLARTALLIVDLQNDFLHPQGAYARGGQTNADIAALPARLAPLARALVRAAAASSSRRISRSCPDATASR